MGELYMTEDGIILLDDEYLEVIDKIIDLIKTELPEEAHSHDFILMMLDRVGEKIGSKQIIL